MIKHIHSATVLVRDQDAALDFYVNKLGFEKLSDDPYGEGSRWVTVSPPGATTALALSKPQDLGMETPPAPGQYGCGISLVTADIDDAYTELSGRGVRFTSPPQEMPWGEKATWLCDPDGNTFFLTQG